MNGDLNKTIKIAGKVLFDHQQEIDRDTFG